MPWENPDVELLDFFKIIGAMRRKEKFMYEAELKVHDINVNYIAFERICGEEKAFIVVNRTSNEHQFIVPEEYRSSEQVYTLKKSKLGLLSPYGGIAIKQKLD